MRLAGLLLLAFALPSVAWAGDTNTELDAVNDVVDNLLRRSKALEDQLTPGTGYISEEQATKRYEDHVYQYLIGDYQPAAEGFFALVTTGALGESSLHRDAEWYLADSLYKMGNLTTAEARFQGIVDQEGHPFRDDAVRQILEIYAVAGRTEDFNRLYEQEVLRGKVQANDIVWYSLGKSFYAQDEVGLAHEQFSNILPESTWYGRAQYFLGTLEVVRGDLDAALPHFRAASEVSVETSIDQEVHDLAILAGARILFEQGRFADSAATYELVSGESEYNDERLYEMVWAYIQQEKWKEALRTVEIFLIAYPEHANAAQLKLVEGHLHVSKQEYDPALTAYENVIEEYGPIRNYFDSLRTAEDPAVYLKQLTGQQGFLTLRLPEFAVSKMLEDPDLAQAVAILTELNQQESDIEISEALIRELGPLLDSGHGVGGFEQMRYDAVLVANQAAEQSLMLLEVEENWLYDELPPNGRKRVDPLRDRRLALIGQARDSSYRLEEAREALERHKNEVRRLRGRSAQIIAEAAIYLDAIAEIRSMLGDPKVKVQGKMRDIVEEDLDYLERELGEASGELETIDVELANLEPPTESRRIIYDTKPIGNLLDEIARLRSDYSDLRPGNRLAPESERIDGLHHSLDAIHGRLAIVAAGLNDVEASEVQELRARFEREVAAVASQRAALTEAVGSTEGVSGDLTREGFGRLADFFTESLLKADMGIVDVYWAQKLATVDEIARVKDEKSALVEELERRFDLIEQKLAE